MPPTRHTPLPEAHTPGYALGSLSASFASLGASGLALTSQAHEVMIKNMSSGMQTFPVRDDHTSEFLGTHSDSNTTDIIPSQRPEEYALPGSEEWWYLYICTGDSLELEPSILQSA